VTAFAFENLKGWRPKGGRKRSRLKAKFHGWLHRLIVKQVAQTAEEFGWSVAFVPPRGTSAWAYDGSGRVRRERGHAALCEFKTGKEYNCDLSASYNIGARYFTRRMARETRRAATPAGGKSGWPTRGKRTRAKARAALGPRMPVTLSTLWARNVPRRGQGEKPHPRPRQRFGWGSIHEAFVVTDNGVQRRRRTLWCTACLQRGLHRIPVAGADSCPVCIFGRTLRRERTETAW